MNNNPPGMWRVGNSWSAKRRGALVTIVENGRNEEDASGRRTDDRLVGAMAPDDARLICNAVNEFQGRVS